MKLNLLKPLRKIFTILSGNNSEDKDLVTVVNKIANVLEENNVNIKNSLPEITENDEDKIIGIVNGKYEKIDQINFEPETIAPKQIVTISETVPKADIQLIQNLNISGISDISDATVIVNGRAFKYDNNYNIFYYDYLEKEIIYLIEEKRENDTFLGITFTAYDNTSGNGSNIISGDYTVEIVRPKNNNDGGGGLFIATYTYDETTEETTCDKTFQEIEQAIQSGKNVIAFIGDTFNVFMLFNYEQKQEDNQPSVTFRSVYFAPLEDELGIFWEQIQHDDTNFISYAPFGGNIAWTPV